MLRKAQGARLEDTSVATTDPIDKRTYVLLSADANNNGVIDEPSETASAKRHEEFFDAIDVKKDGVLDEEDVRLAKANPNAFYERLSSVDLGARHAFYNISRTLPDTHVLNQLRPLTESESAENIILPATSFQVHLQPNSKGDGGPPGQCKIVIPVSAITSQLGNHLLTTTAAGQHPSIGVSLDLSVGLESPSASFDGTNIVVEAAQDTTKLIFGDVGILMTLTIDGQKHTLRVRPAAMGFYTSEAVLVDNFQSAQDFSNTMQESLDEAREKLETLTKESFLQYLIEEENWQESDLEYMQDVFDEAFEEEQERRHNNVAQYKNSLVEAEAKLREKREALDEFLAKPPAPNSTLEVPNAPQHVPSYSDRLRVEPLSDDLSESEQLQLEAQLQRIIDEYEDQLEGLDNQESPQAKAIERLLAREERKLDQLTGEDASETTLQQDEPLSQKEGEEPVETLETLQPKPVSTKSRKLPDVETPAVTPVEKKKPRPRPARPKRRKGKRIKRRRTSGRKRGRINRRPKRRLPVKTRRKLRRARRGRCPRN